MLRLIRCEEEIAPPALVGHPRPDHLERFMRDELSRTDCRTVVRHLLTGCPECLAVTRRLWELGGAA